MANPTTMADTKVRIGEVRFSYLHVFTPDSVDGNEPKYSVSLIIPKSNTALVDRIKAAVKTAYQQGLQSKWGGKAGNWRNPLRDGDIDRPDDEAYRDAWFINASSKTKPGVVKPGMVDGKPAAVAASEEEVYSGCYGYASINFFPYANTGNKGVAAGLNNILKTKDGDYLGGRASAESDFGDLVGELNDLPDEFDDAF